MKILIVDDEFVSLQKLSLLLADKGICDAATSGRQALSMFSKAHEEKAPYELIALDYDMPDLTGPEVVTMIREHETALGINSKANTVKILMVTALSDGKSIMTAFKQGCEGYLTKPFNKESIETSLKNMNAMQ